MTNETQNQTYPINKRGIINVNGLSFDVEIKSVRKRFGHTDLLVKPVTGSGEKWVEHHKVIIEWSSETPLTHQQ